MFDLIGLRINQHQLASVVRFKMFSFERISVSLIGNVDIFCLIFPTLSESTTETSGLD